MHMFMRAQEAHEALYELEMDALEAQRIMQETQDIMAVEDDTAEPIVSSACSAPCHCEVSGKHAGQLSCCLQYFIAMCFMHGCSVDVPSCRELCIISSVPECGTICMWYRLQTRLTSRRCSRCGIPLSMQCGLAAWQSSAEILGWLCIVHSG